MVSTLEAKVFTTLVKKAIVMMLFIRLQESHVYNP